MGLTIAYWIITVCYATYVLTVYVSAEDLEIGGLQLPLLSFWRLPPSPSLRYASRR
jgi:hypothetical protein